MVIFKFKSRAEPPAAGAPLWELKNVDAGVPDVAGAVAVAVVDVDEVTAAGVWVVDGVVGVAEVAGADCPDPDLVPSSWSSVGVSDNQNMCF